MRLLSTIFLSALSTGALFASPATLTSNSAGKCILSEGGNSFQALNIEQPKTNNLTGEYSASSLTSLVSQSNSFSSQLFGEQAYLFNQMSKTGTSDSIVNSIQQAVYSLTDSSYKVDAGAESFVKQAQQCYKTADFSNLVVATLTDNRGADCGKVIIDRTPICDPHPTPVQASATPEPSTFMLLGGGLILAGVYRRKRVTAKV